MSMTLELRMLLNHICLMHSFAPRLHNRLPMNSYASFCRDSTYQSPVIRLSDLGMDVIDGLLK